MKFIIRKATLEDLNDELVYLFDEYRIFYKKESNKQEAFKFLKDRIENNESVIFLAALVCDNEKADDDDDDGGKCVVAKEEKLVGFVQLYPLFSSVRLKKLWQLNDLFVDHAYRNKQVAIKLIEKCKEFIEQTNSCGFILETEKSNKAGNNLYLKAGLAFDTEHNYYCFSH